MLASLIKTCPKFASKAPLKQQNLIEFAAVSYIGCIRDFSLTTQTNKCSGRYGGRLVKKWEEKEYTTKPLKVWMEIILPAIINTHGNHTILSHSLVGNRFWPTAQVVGAY